MPEKILILASGQFISPGETQSHNAAAIVYAALVRAGYEVDFRVDPDPAGAAGLGYLKMTKPPTTP